MKDQSALTELCRVIYGALDCERVAIGRIHRLTGRYQAVFWPPLPSGEERRLRRSFLRHGLEHPRLRAFLRGRPVRGIATWNDLDPDGRFRESGLHREFYAPRGITDQLSFGVPASRMTAIGITVDRAGGRFSSDDVASLQAVLDQAFGGGPGSGGLAERVAKAFDLVATTSGGWTGAAERDPARLSAADYDRLMAALGRISGTASLDEFAVVVSSELLDLVPGMQAAYNEVDAANGRLHAIIRPELGPQWHTRYDPLLDRHLHEHPVMALIRPGEGMPPTEWRDIDPDLAFRRTRLYQEVYRPNGVQSQLSFALPSAPGITIVLAINRDGSPFTPHERTLIEALRPHLGNAYRLVRRLSGHDLLDGPSERRHAVDPAMLAPLGLTPRQAEVLALVASGATNKQIAAALGISPGTVRVHLEQVFERLGVGTRTAAAARALAPAEPRGRNST